MNEKNTQILCNAFPNLYPRLHPLWTDRSHSFYFECRDGWFQLVYDLSEKLEKEIVKYKLLASVDKITNDIGSDIFWPHAVQVKEKFGTLRFYMSSGSDEMYRLIDEAEKISEVTCEQCGAAGELRPQGWWQTLCDEHAEGRKSAKQIKLP